MSSVLITGVAGFIGSFLAQELLRTTNFDIVGIDNFNTYYDATLKEGRIAQIEALEFTQNRFVCKTLDLCDKEGLMQLFKSKHFDYVVNLAAQAGVRYSIDNPEAYVESNLVGFFNLLECCRAYKPKHLVFASSSSVYGLNQETPYSESHKTDRPVSLYAATKKSNELMAHAYANLFDIPMTGLRFFTVYGPFGRPDMAYFKFTNKMVQGEPIELYNNGDMYRDFTYIDDIVAAVSKLMVKPATPNSDDIPFKVLNIGNNKPQTLKYFVDTLEEVLLETGVIDQPTKHILLPMQPGDVYQTYADVSLLEEEIDFRPQTRLRDGLYKFALWYKDFYGCNSELEK